MVNTCIFMGRLTRDPEMRYTQSNKAIASASIALDRKPGNRDSETDFLDLEAWEKTAEMLNQYFKKGDGIHVICRAVQDRWQDKDGNNRTKIKFVVDRFAFPPGKRSDDSGNSHRSSRAPLTGSDAHDPIDDSSIPF